MKAITEKFTSWWAGLAQRERQILAVGAPVIFLLFFYLVIWSPYLNHVAGMRKQLTTQQKLLLWMQNAHKELQDNKNTSNASNQSTTPLALLSDLQKQLERAGLMQPTTQLKQVGSDMISLHFQNVAFDNLLNVIISVLKSQQVSVTQLDVSAQTGPGLVNADVVLRIN